ncbi:DNA polymerase IV [Ponticaulis profundi]|uniref:DNA polymerase IV n=1 Tax=Ponticaulis profundi TaxID=2665222 RepID=A0ABW1SDK5_9PROT
MPASYDNKFSENHVALCRKCAKTFVYSKSCPQCGTPPYLAHPELESLGVAHMDCDAFFAAIEKRDNPDLLHKPVIIGGGKRGVVATACYTARLYGVRSAMPMFKALKACPDAVVVPPNFDKYKAASQEIRRRMDRLTPLVQQVSIDEAYLDLSGTSRLHNRSAAELLCDLQNEIASDIGITVSIGLSFNKFLAKSASELDKPRGFAVIGREEVKDFLSDKSVDFIHGVGPALARQVRGKGYETLSDIQRTDLKMLIRQFGETGQWLHERANGVDKRPVDPNTERKSVSSETTFFEDIRDLDQLEDHLWFLSEKTAFRAKQAGVQGRVITLKLKTADFKTRTRRLSLHDATQLARIIFQRGRDLLRKEVDGTAFRLLGIGISELEPAQADIADLIDPGALKRADAERAADKAKLKFGKHIVTTGRGMRLLAEKAAKRNSDTKDKT